VVSIICEWLLSREWGSKKAAALQEQTEGTDMEALPESPESED